MDIDDNSNDVVAINSDDNEDVSNSDKPIIQLFKRLITSDSRQNTVLTNAQIVEILHKEFDINLGELHEMEGDIYLTIMKKYLKDWPQWDEFDRVVNNLKSENKNREMEQIFESKYINLKNYLKSILDVAQNLAKEYVQKAIDARLAKEKENSKGTTSENSVVLEINASRNQLNQLFFRHPNLDLKNTVFNPTYSLPTQIQLTMLPMEAILNWWGVNINLLGDTNLSIYKREMKHEFKHVLINKKLMAHSNTSKVLDQDIKISHNQLTLKIDVSSIINLLDKMSSESEEHSEIHEFIKRDLSLFPNKIPTRTACKRYTNKYPYVRYLSKDVSPSASANKIIELELEETLSPSYQLYVTPIQGDNATLIVFCVPCSATFSGRDMVQELKDHFDQLHKNEPDWTCCNCDKKFPMATLAQNWWTHRC